jgi:hypothetical protein
MSPFTNDDVDELHDCDEGWNIRFKIGSDEKPTLNSLSSRLITLFSSSEGLYRRTRTQIETTL